MDPSTGRAKRIREKAEETEEDDLGKKKARPLKTDDEGQTSEDESQGQGQVWLAHKRAEDYIEFASNFMLFPTNELGAYGFDASRRQYPLETISALSYLKSPLRRPSVLEMWSPYEIAVFEGAIALHGKEFHEIQKHLRTKSTKEVIDFYYIWKKTSHYVLWKKSYLPPELDISPEEAAANKKGKS